MLRRWFIVIAFFAAVSIVTINLGFGFDGIGTPLSGYTLERSIFQKTPGDSDHRQSATSVASALRPRLGSNQIRGEDGSKLGETFTWQGNVRVNHHDGTLRGFPGYYFYAAFFKVPIAKQIIFLVALVGYFSRRGQPAARGLRREEIFLLVPILVYWIYFNFFFNAQIGIRHVLPVFALATIFCGRFLAAPESKLRRYAAVILVSLGCYIGSFVLSAFYLVF